MNKKKIFAILMSVMMMVTFMPTMAFAETQGEPDILSVTWDADYHGAKLEVETMSAGQVTGSEVIHVNATVANQVGPVITWTLDSGDDNWKTFDHVLYHESDAIKAEMTKSVYSVYDNVMASYDTSNYTGGHYDHKGVYHTWVDAGEYSAWLANKSKTAAERVALGITKDYTVTCTIEDKTLSTEYYEVSYPTYNAYAFDKTGKLAVTLTNAGKTFIKTATGYSDLVFIDPYVINDTVHFDVDGLNTYYTTWGVDGFTTRTATYDGKLHAVTVNKADNVEVTYAIKTKPVDYATNPAAKATYDAAFTDAEYLGVVPQIKEANEYKIGVQFKLVKDGVVVDSVKSAKVFTIAPKTVTVKAKTVALTKAYDGKGFQFADSMFVVDGLVNGEVLFTDTELTEADVNDYYVYADKAVTNKNYTVAYDGVFTGGKCVVSITPAENVVEFTTTAAKSFKAKNVAKAKKTFTVNATATNGTVKFSKMSGSSKKLTLNTTTGKVTVKKGTKKGTYKIKVKAYVAASKNFKAGSVTKTFTVKVK